VKPINTLVSIAIAGLAVALGYHFMASSSLGYRVEKQEGRLEEISAQADKARTDLDAQKKQLVTVETSVSRHSKDLQALERRVAQAEESIRLKGAEIKALQESATKDQGALKRLEEDLGRLIQDYERSRRDLTSFQKESLDRDEDTDRRLKELEKRAGMIPPTP